MKSHLEHLYGFELSEQTISNMTERIFDKAKEWFLLAVTSEAK
ncbi:hypothetical protein [Campylobacter hominis]